MKIQPGSRVSIEFTVTTETGIEIESSKGGLPFSFVQGAGEIIPGLEQRLIDIEEGTQLQLSIPAQEAYGARDDNLIETVPRATLAHVSDLAVGQQYQIPLEDGDMQYIYIAELGEDTVTVDGNHPLAGLTLIYDIKVVSVSAP
jgi:FKBP-type peptidyl-prolyl cis-trans isomerase 2